MTTTNAGTPCRDCRLQTCPGLRPLDADQIAYMEQLKHGETRLRRGESLMIQGSRHAHVHTVYEGVLLRFRELSDGRRQIVNVMFPGDLVGLQAFFAEPAGHTIEALIPARVCNFERGRFHSLMTQHPHLGYDLVWLAAREERALEEHIVSLGRRNAGERVANLAVWLLRRALDTGVAVAPDRVELPITQTQIADMLGLSLVHTNRTIRMLERDGLVEWRSREIVIPDLERASAYAHFEAGSDGKRPFI